MTSGAHISECGRYRLTLWREWEETPEKVLWVMLNPSTADADVDDATIRKCIGFSKLWGLGGLTVVNLFAWRATDPRSLRTIGEAWAIGQHNDNIIAREAESHDLIVAAWGTWAERVAPGRAAKVLDLLGPETMCLRKTKQGQPSHPLYIPYEKALESI